MHYYYIGVTSITIGYNSRFGIPYADKRRKHVEFPKFKNIRKLIKRVLLTSPNHADESI